MCGIVGVIAKGPVNQDIYDALTIVQHRGQDAAGIMTSDGQRVYLSKSNGLVRDAIRREQMMKLQGHVGIGHVRYPTAGTASPHESQPFYVNSPYGLGLVHNGNLTNTEALTNEIIKADLRHLNTVSDSEILLNVVAHELQGVGGRRLVPEDLFKALEAVYARLEGAYAALMIINGYGMVGFRDPHGIRPLVYGKRETEHGVEYMLASESIALDALGFQLEGDVAPGEAIYFDNDGGVHRHQCVKNPSLSPCIFEFIYLSRPDSILDNVSIYQARLAMGKALADKILSLRPDHDIDVVIPIPDTSRTAALPLAQRLGVNFSEGFVKNRYIGRTFIMPGQALRRNAVRLKLNAMKQEFAGKNVLLVDDSIVRGTTSKEIIQMARDAGAKKVYFASAAPEVRYPNVYGIDMPIAEELVAHNRTVEEIADLIGADWLVYQDLDAVYKAIRSAALGDTAIDRFEDAIFTGEYIAGNISREYLRDIADKRNDNAKSKEPVHIVNQCINDVTH